MLNRLIGLSKKYGVYFVVVIVMSLYVIYSIDTVTRNASHERRMWLAVVCIGLLVARFSWYWLSKIKPRAISKIVVMLYFAALAGTCTFGVFNYYQFDKRIFSGLDDYTDIAYYYLNTKYLDELGYFKFYAAMLYSDKTYKNRHSKHIRRYRDLRDYEVKSTKVAFKHGKEVAENDFSKERWRQFQHDCDWFLARKTRRSLQSNFFVDHGYNPPPTWAVMGAMLANTAPVESVKLICFVDIALIIAMLIGVTWAFGAEAMLFVLAFFVLTFSGRWPILGQSLLRFDWSSALILSVCMLKKKKFLFAGMLLSYSAFNRIFPAIFFFPWVATALIDVFKEKRIPKKHLQFLVGSVGVAVLLVGAALIQFGPHTMKESITNLLMHNESYSSQRIGLGDLMVYEGETTRDELRASGGVYPKELKVQAMQTKLKLAGLLSLVFLVFYFYRTRKPLHEVLFLAFLPFFCMTNAQMNYYNIRMILILFHGANLKSAPHRIAMILLMLTEVAGHWSQINGQPRYTTTSWTSIGMAIYLSFMIGWMILEIVQSYRSKELPAPKTVDAPVAG
jgi:hypothetical protein